jgi:hypothetical protein
MLVIDKGIPVPPQRRRGCGEVIDVLERMEVGDSVVFPDSGKRVTFATSGYGKRLGRKFVTRKVDGGRRIWRIE